MGFTHHNEQDEVDPVPEGVGILDKVHHVGPPFQADDLSTQKMSSFPHFEIKAFSVWHTEQRRSSCRSCYFWPHASIELYLVWQSCFMCGESSRTVTMYVWSPYLGPSAMVFLSSREDIAIKRRAEKLIRWMRARCKELHKICRWGPWELQRPQREAVQAPPRDVVPSGDGAALAPGGGELGLSGCYIRPWRKGVMKACRKWNESSKRSHNYFRHLSLLPMFHPLVAPGFNPVGDSHNLPSFPHLFLRHILWRAVNYSTTLLGKMMRTTGEWMGET